MEFSYKLVLYTLIVAAVALLVSAQPPLADESIGKDRILRQSLLRAGKHVAVKPKWGFLQINDTKSAYTQISDLVNNNFGDDNAAPAKPGKNDNGTTPTPKITRSEFLKILDRNFKGIARLRDLEWREAKKDSWTNVQGYWNEIFGGKKSKSSG